MGNTPARAIKFLYKTVPHAKDLKELGTLEIHIIRKKKEKKKEKKERKKKKKRKISVPCFLRKFEGGKNKITFSQ